MMAVVAAIAAFACGPRSTTDIPKNGFTLIAGTFTVPAAIARHPNRTQIVGR